MKFTLSWLKEHLETDASAEAIGEALTAIGLELESLTDPAAALAPFRIARVVEAVPHPNADKLRLLRVDAGDGQNWQVVCGAPNARTGLIGVFAPPGAWVPGAGFEIKVTRIRDVESAGMMCSERELGLGEDHDGIIDLVENAPVGAPYARWAGLDDPLFDVSITPNRQDCMGVRGIARDLAAFGLGALRPLEQVYRSGTEPVAGEGPGPDVRTDDPAGCPAFYAQAVRGVRNGEAPEWMQRRLRSVGQKPISLLVDITNFLSLDLGRPLHVYDNAKLDGPLVARRAREGESVEALNGRCYALDTTMTVIADDAQVHDIGGIMGGMDSGVTEGTRDALIECAFFAPEAIARTGIALNLTSDARQRFERGVDPEFLDQGLAIAVRLILEHGGGSASGVTRAGAPPAQRTTIAFDPRLTEGLGGIEVADDEQAAILGRLGFAIDRTAAPWRVTVPSWRRDVTLPAHLVSEVVRMHGIDHVPSTPLPRAPGVARPTATARQLTERLARRAAAARGLSEAVNWSFVAERQLAAAAMAGDWTLANPISEDLKVMRPSLLPGLLSAARRNLDRGASSVRLFEIGRRYIRGADGASDERPTLGLILAGEAAPRNWQTGKAPGFDAFAAKAEAEALLAALGVDVDRLMVSGFDGTDLPAAVWHPGQAASLRLGPKTVLAAFGALHPRILKAFEIKGAAVAVELYLDALPARRAASPARARYMPPALQPITRDFAFFAPATLPAADLVRAIRGADKAHIGTARVFDRFAGEGIPPEMVSLAVEVQLQPQDRSFDEAALTEISDRIVAAATRLGAQLRA